MKTTFLKPKGKSPPKNKQILFMNPLNLKNMKTIRTIILATALLFSLLTQAQITKGNWMVGGSGYFNNTKSENTYNHTTTKYKGIGIGIDGNIGYFIKDNFVMGLSPNFGYGNPDGSDNSSYGVGVGAFTRYYILKADKLINVFAHLDYGISNGYSNGDKVNGTNQFNIKAGPTVFFNSSVALEFYIGYHSGEVTSYSSEISSNTKFNDVIIGIGFQIYLKK